MMMIDDAADDDHRSTLLGRSIYTRTICVLGRV
jgi:hypothetical protein